VDAVQLEGVAQEQLSFELGFIAAGLVEEICALAEGITGA